MKELNLIQNDVNHIKEAVLQVKNHRIPDLTAAIENKLSQDLVDSLEIKWYGKLENEVMSVKQCLDVLQVSDYHLFTLL
jgi:hypothetical protein